MIDLNGIKLKNRFLVSSGALGYGLGWPWEKPLIKMGIIDPTCFGAVSTKTLTLEPREGNFIDPFSPWWKMVLNHQKVLQKTKNGWLNNLGLWNVGIDYFIKEIFPKIKGINLIISIAGTNSEEYLKLIEKINPLKTAAIEINISCPNAKNEFNPYRIDFSNLSRFLIEARGLSKHSLILKLGAYGNFQKQAYIAGARWGLNRSQEPLVNAIHITNSLPGIKIMGQEIFFGGISGPAIKPQALWAVYSLTSNPDIVVPIIGGGGIYSWKDCQDFFKVGAGAVSFGSVFLEKPWVPTRIVKKHSKGERNEGKN